MDDCQMTIDGQPFSFEIEGEFFWGKDEVLFEVKNNVIEYTDWLAKGYAVMNLFTPTEFEGLTQTITAILKRIGADLGVVLPSDFKSEHYHHYFSNPALHQQVIQRTRFLTYRDFELDFQDLCNRVAAFIGHPLQLENPLLDEEIVILRISRPQTLDINPLHRDGYLEIWANVLNLWIPLAGCNQQSSLPVLPGSHLTNEKDVCRSLPKGAKINGLSYHVPGIVGLRDGIELIRPNPACGQALVFTPFLIHGAAINQNMDQTRLSLELRFCKK
ncbi:MAG: phytanoyl-CoA dioxygenase family protein [Siphonobacter sp.]